MECWQRAEYARIEHASERDGVVIVRFADGTEAAVTANRLLAAGQADPC